MIQSSRRTSNSSHPENGSQSGSGPESRNRDDYRRTYTITELSREYEVTSRTLRFYEDKGLLSPMRDGTKRLYSAQDHKKLAWILRAKRVGFTLDESKEMLDLYQGGEGRLTQRKFALQKSRERLKILEIQKADIEATISELSHFCGWLEGKIAELEPESGPSSPDGTPEVNMRPYHMKP